MEEDVPEIKRFSIENMDLSADPVRNFYEYANGTWLKNNPVPPDKSSWGTFYELRDRNLYILKNICENADEESGNLNEKIVSKFYSSGMNTDLIEKLGINPLENILKSIDDLKTKDKIPDIIMKLHSMGLPSFFDSGSYNDEKNSSIYSFYFVQGGLSLPDRDYYIEKHFSDLLKDYLLYIKNILAFSGYNNDDAGKYADTILEMEKEIANFSRSREALRDSEKNYNRFDVNKLNEKFHLIKMEDYIKYLGVPNVNYVILGQPEFFEKINDFINNKPLNDLKIYLKYNVINFAAPFLSKNFADEHFNFFNKKIMGQEKPEKRWKTIISVINMCIGEALGELYVKQYFTEDAKKRMEILVNDLRSVFNERLKNVKWMSEQTKERAIKKFERFRAKIGYPEKFRDYSSILIDKNDYFGNIVRSLSFEVKRQANRVGKPIDKKEWLMDPQTINAYFSPTDNEIVFPAGILQPPFFDVTMDDAVNYGAIGGVIAHEMTHGYDDQGSMYDEEGNLNNWWTKEDKDAFDKLTKKVIDLYSSIEILPGIKVRGDRTVGENIADLGGVSIAYEALKRRLKITNNYKKIDNFTQEQRFFISWANVWKENIRDEEIKRRVTIDPHAPNKLRATLPVLNHPEFEKVFNRESGKNKIIIW